MIMKNIAILFPHQLFDLDEHPLFSDRQTYDAIYIIEDYLFFRQYKFHKQKIMLHRASMKYYEHYLVDNGHTVIYIESHESKDRGAWHTHIDSRSPAIIHYVDPVDTWLHQDITSLPSIFTYKKYDSPLFLTSEEDWHAWHDTQKKPRMHNFYVWQRKRMNMLIEDDGTPAGGAWSFDAENRKPFPKRNPPDVPALGTIKYHYQDIINEAHVYTMKYFGDHYGSCVDFNYPITHDEARLSLREFINERFSLFGDYEDALSQKHTYLFHSIMTPYLNIGLMTPHTVLNQIRKARDTHNIPLPAYEGFVRQLIGWREFMRGMYISHGTQMRNVNFWNHTRRLPHTFWNGTTGLFPVDHSISKIVRTGYTHHIERLMVLGNCMLLGEYHPDDVYQWFMEMFIDSYDWVMVPNVYGMSQFADGGIFATKPYISGSNYILKMSDYSTKNDWRDTWDALFWKFIALHKDFFTTQARMPFVVKNLEKKSADQKKTYADLVTKFHEAQE